MPRTEATPLDAQHTPSVERDAPDAVTAPMLHQFRDLLSRYEAVMREANYSQRMIDLSTAADRAAIARATQVVA
jgi:hypothetical protein